MQFSQILAVFALAMATTTAIALPETASFDDTLTKIKLAHPEISEEGKFHFAPYLLFNIVVEKGI